MAKPSDLPEWDTTQVNSIAPDSTHKAQGWLAPGGVPEKPPFQTFNHWQNAVYRWVKHVDESISNPTSVSELRAITYMPEDKQELLTLGYYTEGDGGGQAVYWDASSTATDNGVDVFKVTAITTGRFLSTDPFKINCNKAGMIGDGTMSTADMLTRAEAYWEWALANEMDLHFTNGTYDTGDFSFPWRQQIVTTLLDCNNITLYAEGPATIFKTTSSAGADVFQLNGMKNFHVKGFPTLTAELTATLGAGSNGCSVTGGFDNITLEITPTNCQSIDKTTYIDGGKGLTIQTPISTETLEVGSLVAKVIATGCAEGFGYEPDLVRASAKATSIYVDIVAKDCYAGVKVVSGAASGAIQAGIGNGVTIKGHIIDCQKDLQLNRSHGGCFELQVTTTKSAAARRLDPQSVAWFAADTVVESLYCAYAKNAKIILLGNKGACDYKARIGGSSAGSSGLNGSTEFCEIYFDMGGTAGTADLLEIDSGGNTMINSILYVTPSTTGTAFPAPFLAEAVSNTLVNGTNIRAVNPKIAGKLSMAFGADGTTETGLIDMFAFITGLQGKGTAGADAVAVGLYDYSGNFRLGVLNKNGVAIDGISSSSAIGAYVGKFAVYDIAGSLIGYFPIYS